MAWLVRHGAGVDSNAYRGTPLLWAIYSSDVQAATWLLDHGADPNLRHDFGGQDHGLRAVALHLAAQHDSVDCVKLLLNRGADPHIVDGAHGGDALGWAEFSGATRAVEVLKKWTGTYQ
jgi:ankyrin repeat protein